MTKSLKHQAEAAPVTRNEMACPLPGTAAHLRMEQFGMANDVLEKWEAKLRAQLYDGEYWQDHVTGVLGSGALQLDDAHGNTLHFKMVSSEGYVAFSAERVDDDAWQVHVTGIGEYFDGDTTRPYEQDVPDTIASRILVII